MVFVNWKTTHIILSKHHFTQNLNFFVLLCIDKLWLLRKSKNGLYSMPNGIEYKHFYLKKFWNKKFDSFKILLRNFWEIKYLNWFYSKKNKVCLGYFLPDSCRCIYLYINKAQNIMVSAKYSYFECKWLTKLELNYEWIFNLISKKKKTSLFWY